MENNFQNQKSKDINQINNINSDNSSFQNDKNKELLMKLLKEKLDTRLLKLEKRFKTHLSIMKITTEDIKNITNWSIYANKQIKDKLKKDKDKDKDKQIPNKSKKKDNISISGKSAFLKTKTPFKTKIPKSLLLDDNNKTLKSRNKLLNKSSSKTLKTMINRAKSYSNLNKDKKKNDLNNKTNNLKVLGNEMLRRPSIISNKSNKSNKTIKTSVYSKTPRYKKNSKNGGNKNVTPIRKKTPLKKKISINDKAESVNSNNHNKKLSINRSKEKNIKTEIKNDEQNRNMNEMFFDKMELALQKDDLLNNNDPLLIAPITDSDFFPNGKISEPNSINSENINFRKIHLFNFNLEKNINDRLYMIISDYLSLHDLIQFRNISKYFNNLFNIYMINKLKKEKELIIQKRNNLDENNIPPNLTINNFVISNGAKKAINLLNEPQINCKFFEESKPDNDKLLIYRIFFQLINHPFKFISKDKKEELWKKYQDYFSQEKNGKIGELIQKVLDEKMIDIGGNNLYKIYKIVYKELNKIIPSNFSKSCGTTGLFTFFIKDILDFVGLSDDTKTKMNPYWTYTKIIDSIDNKINYIKQLKNI